MTLRDKFKAFADVSLEQHFRKFRAGVIYFGVGGILIYLANAALEPSIRQELVMLGGIILGSIGFIIAIIAQARMVISRVYYFFQNNK